MEQEQGGQQDETKKKPLLKYIVAAAGFVLLTVSVWVYVNSGAGGGRATIVLLHVNDVHGHLPADPRRLDRQLLADTSKNGNTCCNFETIEDDAEIWVQAGGYPVLAQELADREAQAKAEHGADAVFRLHAGDALTGTLYFNLFSGEADAAIMNEVCFDTFTLGNHEFDEGDQFLAHFLGNPSQTSCAEKTAVLGANVFPGPKSPLQGSQIQASKVIERGGVKLGIVGVNTRAKTMEASSPDPGTEVKDELEYAQKEIDKLTDEGIKHIIVVSHIGYANDINLAKKLKNVDAIIGGDSHSLLGTDTLAEWAGKEATSEYPTVVEEVKGEGEEAEKVCVVQAWYHGNILGELVLKFDEEGKVTSCSGAPYLPYEKESISQKYNESGTYNETVPVTGKDAEAIRLAIQVSTANHFTAVSTEGAVYKKVKTLLDEYSEGVKEKELLVIGTVARTLDHVRLPGGRAGTYAHGSEAAPVVAQTHALRVKTACLGIFNAGSVRRGYDAGDINYKQVYEVTPFDTTLLELNITGKALKDTLNGVLKYVRDTPSAGAFPYAWGLRYDVDFSQAEQLINNLEVNCRMGDTWQPLNDNAVYLITATSFLGEGLDGYAGFKDITQRLDTGHIHRDVVIDFIDKQDGKILNGVPDDERPVKSFINKEGCLHDKNNVGACSPSKLVLQAEQRESLIV